MPSVSDDQRRLMPIALGAIAVMCLPLLLWLQASTHGAARVFGTVLLAALGGMAFVLRLHALR